MFEREKGSKKHLGCERRCVCVTSHAPTVLCVWISCLHMCVLSLIRQIGGDAMRGDERRPSRPWPESRGSSDARLHQRCVAPVNPRHTHTPWYAKILWHSMRACLQAPVAKFRAYKLIFFITLVPRRILFMALAAELWRIFISIPLFIFDTPPSPNPSVCLRPVFATSWTPSQDVLTRRFEYPSSRPPKTLSPVNQPGNHYNGHPPTQSQRCTHSKNALASPMH